jgi:hypothetical protein
MPLLPQVIITARSSARKAEQLRHEAEAGKVTGWSRVSQRMLDYYRGDGDGWEALV